MKAGESHLIIGAEGKKRLGRPPNATKARRTTIPVDEFARKRSDLESNERTIARQQAELDRLRNIVGELNDELEFARNKPAPGSDPYAEWAKRSVPELIELLRGSQ